MPRRRVIVLGLGFATIIPACAGPEQPANSEDVLVLEVGGAAESLRQALVAAGIDVETAHRLRSNRPSSDAPIVPAPSPDGDLPAVEPMPVAKPARSPEPVPTTLSVPLARGQTLIHLARQHLGNGNRYRELLEFNGWTEADARRLPEGQQVKIPRLPSPPAVSR